MTAEEKKSWAEELLRKKSKEIGRMPCKDDFDEPTRSRIKAYLGPWPRALEAAGLKEAKEQPPKSKKRKKADAKSQKQCLAARQKLERKRSSRNENLLMKKDSVSEKTKDDSYEES